MKPEVRTGGRRPPSFAQASAGKPGAAFERRRFSTIWGALAILLGATTSSAASSEVRVVGSDLLGVEFSKALCEFAGNEGVRLAVALDGSRPGAIELRSQRANVALLSLPASEEFSDPAFEIMP